ncbi:MAG TPA: hypothetical protein VKH43_04145 [Thermoanaerobaculia bacterium]|nr:hypothetical protein [Thermoanaerobaculia bacterium]
MHLYLGSLFGPLLIAFAVSGAWQLFRFNDAKKVGSYKPARAITLFTDIHKDQVLPGVSRRNRNPPRCAGSRWARPPAWC